MDVCIIFINNCLRKTKSPPTEIGCQHLAGKRKEARDIVLGAQFGWATPGDRTEDVLLILRKAGTQDPVLQCLHLGKWLLQQQNTKKP